MIDAASHCNPLKTRALDPGSTGSVRIEGQDESLGPFRYINVRKLVDFSTSAPRAGERKSFRQFWFFHELNLGPTVQAGDGSIGLLGFGHSQWRRALIAKSIKKCAPEHAAVVVDHCACCSTFSSCTKARALALGGRVLLCGGLSQTCFGKFPFQQYCRSVASFAFLPGIRSSISRCPSIRFRPFFLGAGDRFSSATVRSGKRLTLAVGGGRSKSP